MGGSGKTCRHWTGEQNWEENGETQCWTQEGYVRASVVVPQSSEAWFQVRRNGASTTLLQDAVG